LTDTVTRLIPDVLPFGQIDGFAALIACILSKYKADSFGLSATGFLSNLRRHSMPRHCHIDNSPLELDTYSEADISAGKE
jgi:hypothetical protein